MTDSPEIRLALLHYADVRNFGDVLFPSLVAQELRARLPSLAIDFVSPTGGGPEPGIRYDAAVLDDYDAVVLAGGELIHRYDNVLSRIYAQFGLDAIEHPTDLVFGWSHLQGPYKAWLGLGVPLLTDRARASIASSAGNVDTIVVRGSGSARRFRAAGGRCRIGPDIGWLFSRLVPSRTFSGTPYAVVQVLPQNTSDDLGFIAESLNVLERQGFEIVLLPLSTCWGDEVVLGRLAERSTFRLIDYQTPELSKLQIIADSSMYIGQSMHGFISALATGRRAGLCFPVGDDKFSELLADNDMADLRVGSWEQLPALIERLQALPVSRIHGLAGRAAAGASAEFDDLAAHIRLRAERRRAPAGAGRPSCAS